MKFLMTQKVVKALEGSICKWNDVGMGFGKENGYEDCPLCTLFYISHDCYGCPISTEMRMAYCEGTPYVQWQRMWTKYNPDCMSVPLEQVRDPEFKTVIAEIVEDEIIYLLELLPKGHPWRKMI